MSRVVRTETRKRGVFGKLMKFLFIAFNLLMVVWIVSALIGMGQGASGLTDDYERAGYGVGAALGMGALIFLWVAGDIILGLFVLFTRGKLTVVEEVRS